MRKTAMACGAAAIWVSVAACDEAVITRIPAPSIQIDELKQRPAAKVDILWVVDNSESMVGEQELLAQNFNRFITSLTTCQGTGVEGDRCDFTTKECSISKAPCNPPDYHIGVIATDIANAADQGRLRTAGVCTTSVGTPPGNNPTYCQQRSDCSTAADNARTCDMNQSISYITATTPGSESAFGRAVKVGIGGSGLERGIQAAAMAVGRDADRNTGAFRPAPGENQGFLREDASLFLIFVSDEDDSSFGEIPYYYRAFESLKGAGNEGLVSISAIVGDPDPDGQGTLTGGCPANAPFLTAAPGTRYVALAMYSRGLSAEFRVCDGKRLTCATDQTCQVPMPAFPTQNNEVGLCVPSAPCTTSQECGNFKCGDAGCITCESGVCVAKPDKLIGLLERNGVFGSICSEDYGSVLDALGFEAAGLQRKFPMSKPADCIREVECGDGTAPVCVTVNGEVLPNDRQTGWVWEANSNSIFFDGEYVPPTDADIAISYRASLGERSNGCSTALL